MGYYRTRYPAAMLEQLVRAVRDGSLPPLDRLGLLDDCFALVQAGHTPTSEVSLPDTYYLLVFETVTADYKHGGCCFDSSLGE